MLAPDTALILTGPVFHGPRKLRVVYENDVFTGTDRYYTQGVEVAYSTYSRHLPGILRCVTPWRDTAGHVLLAVAIKAYTPTSITDPSVRPTDRPYCGLAFATYETPALYWKGKVSVWPSVDIGVLGPAASGRAIQRGIHRITGNAEPLGWHNQIGNDVVLNYHFKADYTLLSGSYFSLEARSAVSLGQPFTRASFGVGAFAFSSKYGRRKRPYFTAFANADARLVGYDATLQGGLLNRASTYVIRAGDVVRLVGVGKAGFNCRLLGWSFGSFVDVVTREFSGGDAHRWGGVFLYIPLGYTK